MQRFIVKAVSVGVLFVPLVPTVAQADAIAPLRDPCLAPNIRAIRGHREVCLAPPPKDCPPGHHGVAGGECVLAVCSDETACVSGEQCEDTSLCYETFERVFCEDSQPSAPWSLTGPPRPCPPDRRTYESPTKICTTGATCNGTCRKAKLCVQRGKKLPPSADISSLPQPTSQPTASTTSRPVPEPNPSTTAKPQASTPEVKPASSANPPVTPVVDPSASPRKGGCAGCEVDQRVSTEPLIALSMLFAGIFGLRFRSKKP